MPTAIVMIYTNEGFAVASDSMGSGRGPLHASCEQKIFEVTEPFFRLVYGLSGAVSLPDKDQNGNSIDVFKAIYAQSLSELRRRNISRMKDFADLFVNLALPQMCKVLLDRNIAETRDMKVQFAGYFEKTPSMAERKMSYSATGFSVVCEKTCAPSHPADSFVVGSEIITQKLLECAQPKLKDGETDEFSQFRTTGWKKVLHKDWSISFQEAIDAAEKYIAACSSSQAKTLDPKCCDAIGGYLQSATIKPAEGFKWIHPPV